MEPNTNTKDLIEPHDVAGRIAWFKAERDSLRNSLEQATNTRDLIRTGSLVSSDELEVATSAYLAARDALADWESGEGMELAALSAFENVADGATRPEPNEDHDDTIVMSVNNFFRTVAGILIFLAYVAVMHGETTMLVIIALFLAIVAFIEFAGWYSKSRK